MAVPTQGTQLYFIDPYDNSVVEAGCITNISGLDAQNEQIETTCLSEQARTYIAGLATPGTASFTINADPKDGSHVRLHELYKEKGNLKWAIGWADGTATPTVDSAGEYDLPDARTWLTFDGNINGFSFDFSQNAVVTSQLSVQISGLPEWIPADVSP